jgi:hypothetical protein
MTWFILLPRWSFEHEYREPYVSHPELFAYVDSRVETFRAWSWSGFTRITNKPFVGEVYPELVRLSRTAMRKRFVNPVASARILSEQGILRVHVVVRPHAAVIAGFSLFAAFVLLFVLVGTARVLSDFSVQALGAFLSGLMGMGMGLAFLYFLHQLWFSVEARRLESFFRDVASTKRR